MDIRCRKTKCAYNKNFTCLAKTIHITERLYCATFSKTNNPEPDTSRRLFEKEPVYAPFRECKTLALTCSAKCLFNDKKKCKANGITINALDEKPLCVTFLRK